MQGCVVLECGRLPNLYSREAACHYPGTEDEDLPYRLVEVAGQFEFAGLFAPLKYPKTLRFTIARVSPGGIDPLLPGVSRGDVCRSLGPGDEDEIEAALQIVCLK